MLIYKNKASGKYFIFLDDLGKDKGLFITPPVYDDKVIISALKYDIFFEEPVELEEDGEALRGFLNNKQIECYRVFTKKDRSRRINNVIKWAIETKHIDIEHIKNENGKQFANLIKFIRESTKDLTVDDFE